MEKLFMQTQIAYTNFEENKTRLTLNAEQSNRIW